MSSAQKPSRLALAPVLLALLLAAGINAPVDAANVALPPLILAGESGGEAAIEALGTQLPTVAAHYGLSSERLRAILRRDRTLRLDHHGRLFYVEPRPGPLPAAAGSPVAAAADLDPGRAFQLHSRPGSSRSIHLDFDGAQVSGTAWNVAGPATINAAAFDTDNNPASYSNAERQVIIEVWQRVAEDFAPFDVDVTTEDPGVDAIRRSNADDQQYGGRVIVTRNTFSNCGCGGLSYVGFFNDPSQHDYYQPSWVFFDILGNGSPKYMAEAISHEAGHTLGLHHDGSASAVYDPGHGSGDTAWAPIMGVAYYRNLSQWSKGEYGSANNFEDDLAVMPQFGAAMVSDDASDSVLLPTMLAGSPNGNRIELNRAGLIDRPADVDIYSISIDAGPYSITVSPSPVGPDLDIEARLLDSYGNTLAVANPADRLDASLGGSLAAGTYLLRIDGVGRGDPVNGYSDYGSIGRYLITGTIPRPAALPPLAQFTATPNAGEVPLPVSFDGGLSSDPDGAVIDWQWDYGDGSSGSGVSSTHAYEAVGSYPVTLTVKDNQGLTATSTQTITTRAVAAAASSVRSVSVTVSQDALGYYQCVASVAIENQRHEAVDGARVSGQWSGTAKRIAGGGSKTDGVATIKGAKVRKQGSCVYTVTRVHATGLPYTPANNATSSGSLSY